jgi:hypothetical protein
LSLASSTRRANHGTATGQVAVLATSCLNLSKEMEISHWQEKTRDGIIAVANHIDELCRRADIVMMA